MPKKSRKPGGGSKIGDAQLEVLQYVAEHHPIRVSEVAAHFSSTQGKARTTILTVMEKLREKGLLRRKKRRGAYEYSPVAPKEEIMTSVVGNFIDKALGGSISPLIAYLAEARGLSAAEISELEELVNDLTESKSKRKRSGRGE